MKKLIVGKRYHCNIENDNFEVIEIDNETKRIFLKYDNLHGYILLKNKSIVFELNLIEQEYNKDDIIDLDLT